MAGLTEVPVVIRELDDKETMEIALIENLQRENLTPVEEAKGYKTLMDTYGFTQEQVSESVGKSRSAVANSLRLLNLPEEVLILLADGRISSGHARALLSLENVADMITISQEILDKDLSVRQTEKITQNLKKEKKEPPKKEEKPNFFKEVELALNENLGRKVSVSKKSKGKGGTITLEFYSQDDLIEIANKLEVKE